jgi:hypothetical protein
VEAVARAAADGAKLVFEFRRRRRRNAGLRSVSHGSKGKSDRWGLTVYPVFRKVESHARRYGHADAVGLCLSQYRAVPQAKPLRLKGLGCGNGAVVRRRYP